MQKAKPKNPKSNLGFAFGTLTFALFKERTNEGFGNLGLENWQFAFPELLGQEEGR